MRLTKQDRDTRVAVIDGRRFEVITCRNTRGNISGWGIFERWPEPRPTSTPGINEHGEWHIDPAQASFGECREWLEAFARGDRKPLDEFLGQVIYDVLDQDDEAFKRAGGVIDWEVVDDLVADGWDEDAARRFATAPPP